MAESFESARTLILEKVLRLPAESVGLLDAGGRVLAEDFTAPYELPRWDNSAMDGFAVHVADCQLAAKLTITGYIPAGGIADDLLVVPGSAVKIMTGAPIPAGCHAVVPIEDTLADEATVILNITPQAGEHIRFRGEDIQLDEVVMTAGCVLGPAEISLLASFGFNSVKVRRRPTVAILSTGDELVEPGQPVGPGQIVNSNAYSLAAAVKEAGGEPILLGIARDNRASLLQKISEGLQADVLITTAGVSMGDRDLVCEMLQEAGVERLFWKVDIKPGRPTAFSYRDGKPVFSLPGNPVSSMVTFEQFVRPALLKMQGYLTVIKPTIKATLQKTIPKKTGRTQFLRVLVAEKDGRFIVTSAGDQNTGILRTMLKANGIALLPADRSQIEAGEEVDVQLLNLLHPAIAVVK